MAVISLIHDVRDFHESTTVKLRTEHLCRLLLAFVFLFWCLGMQIYLIVMTKYIVTPKAVQEMRETYEKYEQEMYPNHTYLNANGRARGISRMYFNASHFPDFVAANGSDVCDMPMTQPVFTFCIILLWAMTCLRYARSIFRLTNQIYQLDTVSKMTEAVHKPDETNDDIIVRGLPCWAKLFIIVCIQMPSFIVTLILLWIGSRWLVATMGFDELVLNAIALEFILNMSEMFYFAVVPLSMKNKVENIKIPHTHSTEPKGLLNMFGTFLVFVIAIAWSALYVLVFQRVLLQYKWDLHDVCASLHPVGDTWRT